MAITSLSAAVAANQANSPSKAPNSADAVASVLQKADKRIQEQRDLAAVQLSAFGKLKSSFSDVQASARALSDTKQTATNAGITKAANNFVKAFNNAAGAARSAAQNGAPAQGSRARAAQSDLARSISADATATAALKKIGITQQQDGTLAIDANKFQAALNANPEAVRSTLSTIGQQVDQTATRELASTGNIGRTVNSLDNRAKGLENQQADQQAQAAAAQAVLSAQTVRLNNVVNSQNTNPTTGAAAYLRIFST